MNSTTTRPQVDTDIRALFADAVATGATVIANIRPDQLDAPTPCPDFDVRQLTAHLVEVLHRVTRIGRGEDPFGRPPTPPLSDDGWLEAWTAAGDDVRTAWTDDATLTRSVVLPWSQQSGADTLATFASEVSVRTWDLATATGQRPQWNPAVLEAALAAITAVLPAATGRLDSFEALRAQLPEQFRNATPPFADAVPVADDAALIDRLVAWNGRRP